MENDILASDELVVDKSAESIGLNQKLLQHEHFVNSYGWPTRWQETFMNCKSLVLCINETFTKLKHSWNLQVFHASEFLLVCHCSWENSGFVTLVSGTVYCPLLLSIHVNVLSEGGFSDSYLASVAFFCFSFSCFARAFSFAYNRTQG